MAILPVSCSLFCAAASSPGVHVDTKVEVLVQKVLLLARVRESDIAESNDRWRELLDVLEVESQEFGDVDSLDQTGSLHLVDNLLLGLGLLNQVGVGTGGSNELCLSAPVLRGRGRPTLDVGNLLLLLGVCLHLVDLVFGLGSDVGRVITTVVLHLLPDRQVHDVGADLVHEVGGVATR